MSSTPGNKNRRAYLWLFLGVFAVRLIVAALIREPGYMDTAYYTVQGLRLAEGAGATEPYLWNYLDAPEELPHLAFGYWMPLPSLLVASFWMLSPTFFAAQIPFALLSALLAVCGGHIARTVSGRWAYFWAAGLLLTFSVYFFPFWTLPETFAPFALCGALALWAGGRYWESRDVRWAALAAATAVLAYLTRSDGLLLVALALVLPVLKRDGKALVTAGIVTLLVLSPWLIFNRYTRGTLLPTGGTQTLWLTNYDDIFCYRCELTPRAYRAWGWAAIVQSKLDALAWNLRTLLAVVGYIFLWPFALIGGWRLRKSPTFVLAWSYLLLLFAAMTFAFSFPGPRGGFFHSAGALLPFIVAAALVGIERAVVWIGNKRRWNIPQAQRVFLWGFVLLAVILSGLVTAPKLAAWRQANALYAQANAWLTEHDPEPCPVLVGSPPNFWYVSRIPALMAPNEDADIAAEVAQRYGACWLLLDANRPKPLADFYAGAANTHWEMRVQWETGKLYQLVTADF